MILVVGRGTALAVIGMAIAMFATPVAPAAAEDQTPRQAPADADLLLRDSSGNWAAPRCIGNGVSGSRVQSVFVNRSGYVSRFSKFQTVLERSTFLTTGIFERSSRGQRTVRWVHDSQCRPVIWQVDVPAAHTYDLVSLRRYLQRTDPRFRSKKRVYSLWVDATTSPRWSGLGGDRWSATWSSSFGFIWVDTHELVHALGAVSPGAPHATGKGHCYDAYDVMCYSDGGVAWRKTIVCPARQASYRLDCGQDDYFAVDPRGNSWLARNPGANVANSRFLAAVGPRLLLAEPPAPTQVRRNQTSVDWLAVPGVTHDVGHTAFNGRLVWVGQNLPGGQVMLTDVPYGRRVFVRAVNDAGYSGRVFAASQ